MCPSASGESWLSGRFQITNSQSNIYFSTRLFYKLKVNELTILSVYTTFPSDVPMIFGIFSKNGNFRGWYGQFCWENVKFQRVFDYNNYSFVYFCLLLWFITLKFSVFPAKLTVPTTEIALNFSKIIETSDGLLCYTDKIVNSFTFN